MQPIRTIWTISVGDHRPTIPVEFGRIPMSVSREEVVWTFPYIIQCDARTLNYIGEKEQRPITLKLGSGGLWFLCSALVLNKIYTPLKFHVQICNRLWDIAPTTFWRPDIELYKEKRTKGNNSKIRKWRVMVLVQCICPQWDLYTPEVSIQICNSLWDIALTSLWRPKGCQIQQKITAPKESWMTKFSALRKYTYVDLHKIIFIVNQLEVSW